ncbi:hypothetical protein NKG05_21960 [Oerskovia sp. M15]
MRGHPERRILVKLRTSRGLVAIALGTALVLTGCSTGGATAPARPQRVGTRGHRCPDPTAEDIAAVDAVKVVGDPGAEPTLEFEKGLTVSVPTTRIVTEGTGEELTEGNQATMQFVTYNGADATKSGTSSWEADSPQSFTLGDEQFNLLNEPLIGQKVGARLLLANPIQDGDTVTTVLNLVEVTAVEEAPVAPDPADVPGRAEGEAVTPADGLPVVTLDDSGKPSVTIPEGYTAPTELVVQPLIKGPPRGDGRPDDHRALCGIQARR